MTSAQFDTNEFLNNYTLSQSKSLSENSKKSLQLLIQQARSSMSEKQFTAHLNQWKVVEKKFNTNDKLSYLKQKNCRQLVIVLIRQEGLQIFNCSYLNRAKIDSQYLKYLKSLGPYFFIEVIMIVSKLKTIHKYFYQQISSRMIQNHVGLKIIRILELCNEKKRSINNNKSKFLCIVEDEADRFEITKQLGKLLRAAWKRQKSKQQTKQSNNFNEQIDFIIPTEYKQQAKNYVKIHQQEGINSYISQEQISINLSPIRKCHGSLDFFVQ